MMVLNIILLALNFALVPIAFMFGWARGIDERDKVNWELYDANDKLEKAYADFGRYAYGLIMKEDNNEQGRCAQEDL